MVDSVASRSKTGGLLDFHRFDDEPGELPEVGIWSPIDPVARPFRVLAHGRGKRHAGGWRRGIRGAHPARPMMMVKAPVRVPRGPIESFMLMSLALWFRGLLSRTRGPI